MVVNIGGDVKCVVVGDGGVGKTSMLLRYIDGRFLEEYIPTCFDSYAVSLDLGDRYYDLCLMDTAGQETYDRLRTLSYFNTDVFVVCFSVASQDSFTNVRTRWIPELKEFKPGTRFILVGTQADLREDAQYPGECVSLSQAKKLARKVGAEAYVECSSLTGDGLKSVFHGALTTAVCPKKKRKFWRSFKQLFKKNEK
ncbi:rho-related GTP-binding protein RhoQ-like [Haliotis rufescens]|uniref:rho-related GTP-binding protein RhoQ-like n=1 Tax=Haliotis rufescens TaxID=6454 RepID=UPI001EB063AA|nr:rho-related GTP-binding protein RhoQ-like [Haliotis rufescens]